MDKKKIISSLALAGILSASVLGANVNATAGDYLKPVGVYKQLISGRTVVPYVLENASSKVTVKDVKGEFANLELVNGNNVTDESYVLKTGDTFKADSTEYSVIVYGDVDKNGVVDTFDALEAQQIYLGSSTDAFKNEATDVINDGTVDTFDALRIQQFYLGNESAIDKVPEAEAPEEEESIYTVSVNDNGYINEENAATTSLKINLKETLDKEKILTVKTSGIKAADDSKLEEEQGTTITVPAHTDYVDTAKLDTPVTYDLSAYKDGEVKIQLLDGKNVVATVTAIKNTEPIVAAQVITERTSTKNATLSLIGSGKNDVTKAYYIVVANDGSTSAPAAGSVIEADKFFDKANDNVRKEVSVSNNALVDEVVSTDLATNTTYTVYYVVENQYGTRSEMGRTIISTDVDTVTQPKKVEEVKIPADLKGTTAEFTWKAETGITYTATLYKDGTAIAEKSVAESAGKGKVDFAAEMTEAGTYKVAVYAPATTTSKASEVTESAEVKVEKLAAVTDLGFKNEKIEGVNHVILSWKNSVDKDDFANYEIIIYSVDKDGKETEVYKMDGSNNTVAKDKTEVDLTAEIDPNVVYVAKAKLIANNEIATTDSEQVVSSEFFRVEFPEVNADELLENQITLNVEGISINGEAATYEVKIYSVNEEATLEDPVYTYEETRDVEIKDKKIVIDGLDSNTPYGFKLVVNVNGEEVESDYSDPIYTIPEINNLKVVAEDAENKDEAGNVYYSTTDSTIYIAGQKIDKAKYNNSSKLNDIIEIVEELLPGEAINVDGDKITITLDAEASETGTTRDFSGLTLTRANKTTLEFVNNGFNKNIKTPTDSDNKIKEVILSGDALFTLTDINAEKITVNDGVEVTGDKTIAVAANSTVIINGASVTVGNETEITPTSGTNTLTVTANEEENNLVFENKKDTNLTINFEGLDNNTSEQAGSIIIKSNGGKVTVASEGTNVSADLSIEVNNGDVDIQEPSLTGNKDISVSLDKDADATLEVLAATKAPATLTGVSVDLTDEELLEQDNVTEDNLDEVKAFLASFGLNGTGATISATKDSNEVTITITAPADEGVEIGAIGNLDAAK